VYAKVGIMLFIFSLFKTKIMKKKMSFGFAAILFMLGVACRKVPDVSCNSPTNDAALARELIISKWRLDRIKFSLDSSYTWYPPQKGMIDIHFKEDGVLEYYIDDECVDSCRYEIDIMKKYTLYFADTTRNVLRLLYHKQGMIGLEGLVPLRICSDTLYLPYESFRYDGIGDCFYYRK
jgi:hypothetical protein